RRTIDAVEAFTRRHRHHVGDALGRHDRRCELGDGPHHVDVWKILQAAHTPLSERALAADVEYRALRAKRRGDAGYRVGASGSRGRHDATEPARLARVAVGGVGRGLFVAHVDDTDALVDT